LLPRRGPPSPRFPYGLIQNHPFLSMSVVASPEFAFAPHVEPSAYELNVLRLLLSVNTPYFPLPSEFNKCILSFSCADLSPLLSFLITEDRSSTFLNHPDPANCFLKFPFPSALAFLAPCLRFLSLSSFTDRVHSYRQRRPPAYSNLLLRGLYKLFTKCTVGPLGFFSLLLLMNMKSPT